jgi:hypothetical protein
VNPITVIPAKAGTHLIFTWNASREPAEALRARAHRPPRPSPNPSPGGIGAKSRRLRTGPSRGSACDCGQIFQSPKKNSPPAWAAGRELDYGLRGFLRSSAPG